MKIQTQSIENHIERLEVSVDVDRWQKAKKDAAKRLAENMRIPGFRKGKAPYKMVVRHVGEAAIIEQAVEQISGELYREALTEIGIEPYTSGSLEDFELDDEAPTFVYSVPKQPEVDLGDYRSIRVDYVLPEVTEEDLKDRLRRLQYGNGVYEESQSAAKIGDRLTVDVHSKFVDGLGIDDENPDGVPVQGSSFVHGHEIQLILDDEITKILPGFAENVAGAEVGDTVTFDLTVPEDHEDDVAIRGRTVHFEVKVSQIENVTLPAINDDFAARFQRDDDQEPPTLLTLRARLRAEIAKEKREEYEETYFEDVFHEMKEQARAIYPDVAVEERIDTLIEDFSKSLQQRGVTLDMYYGLMNVSEETLREDFREHAEDLTRRQLVMGKIFIQEDLLVTDEEVQAFIERIASLYDEESREHIKSREYITSIINSMAYNKVIERVIAIGKGEAPSLEALRAQEVSDDVNDTQTAETTDEVESTEDSEPTPASVNENDAEVLDNEREGSEKPQA